MVQHETFLVSTQSQDDSGLDSFTPSIIFQVKNSTEKIFDTQLNLIDCYRLLPPLEQMIKY